MVKKKKSSSTMQAAAKNNKTKMLSIVTSPERSLARDAKNVLTIMLAPKHQAEDWAKECKKQSIAKNLGSDFIY